MKKITLFIALVTTFSFAKGQSAAGLEGVVVEKYYQTNSADGAWALSNGAVTTLNSGTTVYRVYLDLAPGYKFVQMFGNTVLGTVTHPLVIKTTTNFYNDPNNGQAIGPQANSLNNTKQGTTLIDSYLTVGGVCAGKMGIPKTMDTDGSIGNTSGILTNSPGGAFGVAINSVVAGAQDGLMPGTPLAPTVLGIGTEKDVFDQTAGNTFSCNSCAVSGLGGVAGTSTANMVLIGQFTTDGILSFSLNVQLSPTVNPTASEIYVPGNVQAGENLFPALAYTSATTPTTTVGLENLTNGNGLAILSVFPNPTKGLFTIHASNVKENSTNVYSVYDVAGNLVLTKSLDKVSTTFSDVIDLSNFAGGIYFVTLSMDGFTSTRKIVKE